MKHVPWDEVPVGAYFHVETYNLNGPITPSKTVFRKLEKVLKNGEKGICSGHPIIQVFPELGTHVNFWNAPVFLLDAEEERYHELIGR